MMAHSTADEEDQQQGGHDGEDTHACERGQADGAEAVCGRKRVVLEGTQGEGGSIARGRLAVGWQLLI